MQLPRSVTGITLAMAFVPVTGQRASTMLLPYRILVVDDDANALSGMVEILRDANYVVTGAATYDAAKRLLALGTFDLFVTDIRLRGFNGLNLVRQSNADHREMAIMIVTGYDEPMIELEAARYRAEFLRKPLDPATFVQKAAAGLARVRRQRRWSRKRVVGGFRVLTNGRPAAVVDVSYGGLQLEIPSGGELAASFDIEVAGMGLHLIVDTAWTRHVRDRDIIICGAAIATDASPESRTWRAIVDRLTT